MVCNNAVFKSDHIRDEIAEIRLNRLSCKTESIFLSEAKTKLDPVSWQALQLYLAKEKMMSLVVMVLCVF